jgi:hypothetical protein
MKLGFICSPHFQGSFNTLMELKSLPIKTLFKLRGINKIIKEKAEEHETLKNQILSKWAKKDESGKIIFVDGDKISFNPADGDLINKELKDLYDILIEIPEIPSSDLGDSIDSLNAKDISNLEFIVE